MAQLNKLFKIVTILSLIGTNVAIDLNSIGQATSFGINSALNFAKNMLNTQGASFSTIYNLIYKLARPATIEQWSAEVKIKAIKEKELNCDFIIVGGGAAGSVLANRLSEVPEWTICLFEAGGTENFLMNIPITCAYWTQTDYVWNYTAEQQPGICEGMTDRRCSAHVGKGLGGTTLVNFMITSRGHPNDYDRLRPEFGIEGWSYEEVLPYFKKVERSTSTMAKGSWTRGFKGAVSSEDSRYKSKVADAALEAMKCAGYDERDPNGYDTIGVSRIQALNQRGRRQSAARAYIYPIADKRTNLKIVLNAHVIRILIDPVSKTAFGVEYRAEGGKFYKSFARNEVILSAGSIGSAKLLMLSGIGPKDHLESLEIPVIQDLPVGRRLHDHLNFLPMTYVTNTTGETIHLANMIFDPLKFSVPALSFLMGGKGPWTSRGGVEVFGYVNTDRIRANPRDCSYQCGLRSGHLPHDAPDIEILFALATFASDLGQSFASQYRVSNEIYEHFYKQLEPTHIDAFQLTVILLDQKSSGLVQLRDSDPFSPPRIFLNFFQHPEDMERLLIGIREAQCIASTTPMRAINATLICHRFPACEAFVCDSDDYYRCAIRLLTSSIWRYTAVTRMGAVGDPAAVVTPDLRVQGVDRLRVADIGVIPHSTTAHLAMVAYMIGERASDEIKRFHGKQIDTGLEVRPIFYRNGRVL